MKKVLFVLKKRSVNYGNYSSHFSSGLLNSVTFLNNMLVENNVNSTVVEVIDSNGIDKVVYENKPEIVIIEAWWANPAKMNELQMHYPKIHWVIRSHSNLPFFAQEAHSLTWANEYLKIPCVSVAANNLKLYQNLLDLGYNKKQIVYLPNYYPINEETKAGPRFHFHKDKVIKIGGFGASRVLKNQAVQALAAIKFANKHDLQLNYHIIRPPKIAMACQKILLKTLKPCLNHFQDIYL